MTTTPAAGFPPRFRFAPRSSALQRIAWRFTRAGRLRRLLWRAARHGDRSAREALARDVAAHLADGRTDHAGLRGIVRDGLLYLAGYDLDAGNLPAAADRLSELDAAFPDLGGRLSLRWELLEGLRAAGSPAAYHEAARRFLADPAVRWPHHSAAVLHVLDAVYERSGAAPCAEVLAAAHAGLSQTPQVQSALTLCRCPEHFAGADEAREWADRLSTADLRFSPRMQAGAWLSAARAAEWAGDRSSVADYARRAAETMADCQPAYYWWTRGQLYQHACDFPSRLRRVRAADTPEWARLGLLRALHEKPTPENARAALGVLTGRLGAPDDKERELTFDLLRAALCFDPSHHAAAAQAAAAVCRELEQAAGRQPWAQLTQAVADIRAERRYAEAAARLDAPDVRALPLAATLAWAARLLARVPEGPDLPPHEACRHMTELERSCPTWRERVSVRWELLARLRAGRHWGEFATQAARFLADPLDDVDLEERPQLRKAVRHIVRVLYQDLSPAACAEALAGATAGIRRAPEVAAALALCNCPPRFTSADEARSWQQHARPADLDFSEPMKAGALLVASRAAEWAGDWVGMEAHALEALALEPASAAARYWAARARLHQPGTRPEEVLQTEGLPVGGAWARLRALVNLHAEPSLPTARALLSTLADRTDAPCAAEEGLFRELLRPALLPRLEWSPTEAALCGELCLATERHLGRQPWTELGLAAKEVRLDGHYRQATGRLQQEEVLAQPEARDWSRVARILAGSLPKEPAEEAGGLAALEKGLLWLLRGVAPARGGIDSLRRELEQAGRDRWCRLVPALLPTIGLVACALDVLVGPAPAAEAPPLPAQAPTWQKWLQTRLALLRWGGADGAVSPAALEVTTPAVAWSVEGYWALYGHPAGPAPPAVEGARRCLDTADVPQLLRQAMEPLRRARHGDLRLPLAGGAVPADGWDLGDDCTALARRELEIEAAFWQARRHLAAGQTPEALQRLERLIRDLGAAPPVVAAWWLPALRYWYGVTLARGEPDRARAILASLCAGPKGSESRAQLAMLALQANDLATAGQLLDGLPPAFPGVVYAQALLCSRRGDAERARSLLAHFADAFGQAPSPYLAAANRLGAALEERHGNFAEAVRLHTQTLAAHPEDAVTAARLGRLLVRKDHGCPTDSRPDLRDDWVAGLLKQGSQQVAWCRPYQLLHRLLTCPEPDLEAASAEIPAMRETAAASLPWCQVLAHRFLEAGQPDRALDLLEATGPVEGPPWHLRTRLILRAWSLLRRVWVADQAPDYESIQAEAARIWREEGQHRSDAENWQAAEVALRARALAATNPQEVLEAAAACAVELEKIAPAPTDELCRRWRFLLRQAVELGAAEDVVLRPDSWQELASWPVAQLPGLWAPEERDRARAADALARTVDTVDLENPWSEEQPVSPESREVVAWSEEQRLLVRALVASAAGKEDEYLHAYRLLEPALDRLPVEGTAVWRAAAAVWFRRKNWKALLQGDLPACVADLADPEVRLLLALAYARAAAEDSEREDFRTALQNARRARSTLEEFLER